MGKPEGFGGFWASPRDLPLAAPEPWELRGGDRDTRWPPVAQGSLWALKRIRSPWCAAWEGTVQTPKSHPAHTGGLPPHLGGRPQGWGR